MCDYSLHHVKSRPAKVGDKLRTINFRTGTRGFAAPEDSTTAVELAVRAHLADEDRLGDVMVGQHLGGAAGGVGSFDTG